jgi:hypothetical protein
MVMSIVIDNLEERGPYVEKIVLLMFQEPMEKDGWETFAYEEYYFNGYASVPKYAVMRKYKEMLDD